MGIFLNLFTICQNIYIVLLRFDVTSDEAEVIIQLSQIDNKSTVLARFDIYISFHYFDSN